MGAIKRALSQRQEQAALHCYVVQQFIDAIRSRLENDSLDTVMLVIDDRDRDRWRAAYNLLDDFEQAVGDYYEPMMSWPDDPDEVLIDPLAGGSKSGAVAEAFGNRFEVPLDSAVPPPKCVRCGGRHLDFEPCSAEPRCDVCNAVDETVEWCGSCGCCVEHCQKFEGCPDA